VLLVGACDLLFFGHLRRATPVDLRGGQDVDYADIAH